MDPNQKRPTGEPPPLVLRAFYLRHGESFTPGTVIPGVGSSLTHWDREKHGAYLVCEEQKNGDVWLATARGTRVEISVLAISYKVRGPEKLGGVEAVRRG